MLLGAIVYVESLPAEYEAEAVVALTPRSDSPTASSDSVRIVAPSYVAYLTAPATIREVARDLSADPTTVGDAARASVAPDSGNLTISATSLDKEDAPVIANAFADAAVELSQTDELLEAKVIAPAVTPGSPSGPPRKLLEAAALLVGLLLGTVTALLLERGRPRIRSWRDIYDLTGYTVVARVPRSRVVKARPKEAFADPGVGAAFRTLRTNVERALAGTDGAGGPRSIGVASARSGDGKTMVAALFAESIARLGSRVLLIDGDLSRSGLTKTFGYSPDKGTSDVLRGSLKLESAVQPGWVENLFVLPTRVESQAGDLIAGRLGGFLEEALAAYDTVVIDSAPLVGTDEGRTIATHVGGVLLVARAGEMSGPVNEAVLALEDLKVPVIGVVGNRLRKTETGQYYR